MEVFCKCGYSGNQMVVYETKTPSRQLVEWQGYSYYNYVKDIKCGTKTLNWACPKCGGILVQQRGGLSYNQPELEDMRKRLWHNNFANGKWIKDLEKTKIKLKELSDLVDRANKITGVKND